MKKRKKEHILYLEERVRIRKALVLHVSFFFFFFFFFFYKKKKV
jgi:hypothetical protein